MLIVLLTHNSFLSHNHYTNNFINNSWKLNKVRRNHVWMQNPLNLLIIYISDFTRLQFNVWWWVPTIIIIKKNSCIMFVSVDKEIRGNYIKNSNVISIR